MSQKELNIMGDYLPRKDMEFQEWLSNFLSVTKENSSLIGVSSEDLKSLAESHSQLINALESVEITRTAYLQATQIKETVRNAANAEARSVVRRVQANPRVTSALKSKLNITVREIRAPQVPLTAPTKLVAVGYDNGQHDLRWQRSGNPVNAHYIIESKVGTDLNWTKLDVVTATKYRHTGQSPGVKIVYRIIARRSGKLSTPSNEFTLYGESA